MRLNKYLAQATGMSRRQADAAVAQQRVRINNHLAVMGQTVGPDDQVYLDNHAVKLPEQAITVMLNKPVGYVCSRDGQGSPTVYDLLPAKYHSLKPVGRLDKDSSGLLLLTNDGKLAHQLSHPSFQKQKVYAVELDKQLSPTAADQIEQGVKVENYTSQMHLDKTSGKSCQVTIHTGKNRQIRKTFAALGYRVVKLHRTKFGPYELSVLSAGQFGKVKSVV